MQIAITTDPLFTDLLKHYKHCRCEELRRPSNYSCGTTGRNTNLTQRLTANFYLTRRELLKAMFDLYGIIWNLSLAVTLVQYGNGLRVGFSRKDLILG